MSNNEEKALSDYIDRLNAQHGPAADAPASPGLEQLFKTVNMVRSLKEPEMPEEGYANRLAQAVAEQLTPAKKAHLLRRRWFLSLAAAAAVLVAVSGMLLLQPFAKGNIVYAMEQSFNSVKTYHGMIDIVEKNAAGQATAQAKLEVWADKQGHYYEKELTGAQQGLVTVNNGQQKWQIQPAAKQVTMFPASPDPYQFTFNLGKEIDTVKSAVSAKTIGTDTIAGRETTVLQVTPQGGAPYRLWIDKETNLPLQKQSAMQNSIQYTITYSQINFADQIPAQLLAYSLPAGYREVNASPEQNVASLEEARGIIGFMPKLLTTLPDGYANSGMQVELRSKTFKISYASVDQTKHVVILESKAASTLNPASSAILGKLGGNTVEIQSPVRQAAGILGGGPYASLTGLNSIRWQQDGFEYAVVGNLSLQELQSFVNNLTQKTVKIPTGIEKLTEPQIQVPVAMQAEKNDQKNVDRGSSPWKLDPAYVAQVFVSLKMSPQGIQGDYPIDIGKFSVIKNTGTKAVVAVSGNKTPISKVYLKRLVRQDSTGIWTVIGYDPKGK